MRSVGGHSRRGARAGFTLIEAMIVASLMGVIALALIGVLDMGSRSQATVMDAVDRNREARSARTELVEELKLAGDATIVVTELADGNHDLRFQHPVVVGGVPGWGVCDDAWGKTPDEWNRPNWSLWYTVLEVAVEGGVERRLVRRVEDELGDVRSEHVVLSGLRSGDVDPPGFHVERAGDMWEIRLTTAGHTENSMGKERVFHVSTRN